MTDWTIEQFENAVKEAIEENLTKKKQLVKHLKNLKKTYFQLVRSL